ncbi:MAG: hypothetical protein KGY66_05900 [Candidatus Thermoplasmatota archaeon]|nr:hypothetical protein [Candidatus Thermoplasmatota archaeon]MBS3790432.1 hypothetical protein [Candidatus Thermoplasmatota archaeon]
MDKGPPIGIPGLGDFLAGYYHPARNRYVFHQSTAITAIKKEGSEGKNTSNITMFRVKIPLLRRRKDRYLHLSLGQAKNCYIGENGIIAVKLPLPLGTFITLWNNKEKFKKKYINLFLANYLTRDAGFDDELSKTQPSKILRGIMKKMPMVRNTLYLQPSRMRKFWIREKKL